MRSNFQTRSKDLLSVLADTRQAILVAASAISSEKQERVFLGVWSVMDLLAHLAGWDYANLEAIQALQHGRLPAFYAYTGPDWREYNARLVAQYRQATLPEQLAVVQVSHKALIDGLKALPAEEFEQDWGVRWKGIRVSIARLMQAELKDEKVHLSQIQEYLDSCL